ncbi:MAG: Na+/H+ antiporter NhaA [Candidatus Promineifilaceae bacterium]
MSGDAAATKSILTLPVTDLDHIQGPFDAPVTLLEYGDYQCPHCRLVSYNIKDLQERLGDRMRYVYRHLPISSIHPDANFSAEAAEAAGAQGKFWEMHDLLYEHEELDKSHVIEYAEELGLDMDRFCSDIDDHVHSDRVRDDFRSGIRSGVNGTPTFFLNGERYDGAWDLESLIELVEKPLGVRVNLLTQKFIRQAASGGIVLLIFTIIALLWRNLPGGEGYIHFWEQKLSITVGNLNLSESLLHWINDGLMVIFFFVVGLEIKREVLTGELGSPRRAALPVAGAIGGMLFPAAIYLAFNSGGPAQQGWGIPMATDIAFTLGILTMLGSRVPLPLKVFFTALAIADDLGAILVIAIFYTSEISWISLGIALIMFVALIGLNRARIYSPFPYVILGVGLWLAFLQSGIHPTIAGVLLALTIPSRSPVNIRALLAQVITLLQSFELPVEWRDHPDSRRQAAVSTMEHISERMQSPAQRLEESLSPWTTYIILPLFALANAGVLISPDTVSTLTSSVSLGVILGLVVGKPVGITFVCYLAVRFGLAELGGGVQWRQLAGASFLAGIGFTMSLFISSAAFAGNPTMLEISKLAILVASIVAAALGTVFLLVTSPSSESTSSMQAAATATD